MGAEVLLRESESTRSWENNSEYKSADEKENSFACFAYYQVLYAFLISTTRFTLPYLPPLLLLGLLLLGLLLLLPLLLMIMDISSSPSQVSQRCLPKKKKKKRKRTSNDVQLSGVPSANALSANPVTWLTDTSSSTSGITAATAGAAPPTFVTHSE